MKRTTSASPPPELIGSGDACELLGGITRTTLTRWVQEGRIEAAGKLPSKNGAFFFDRRVVEEFAAARTAESAATA